MKKAVYQLESLTCPSCMKKIETALEEIAGVQSVKIFFNSGKVRTEFDEEKVSADAIASLIKKLGYEVLRTKVS